jgi:hypothetical protein
VIIVVSTNPANMSGGRIIHCLNWRIVKVDTSPTSTQNIAFRRLHISNKEISPATICSATPVEIITDIW